MTKKTIIICLAVCLAVSCVSVYAEDFSATPVTGTALSDFFRGFDIKRIGKLIDYEIKGISDFFNSFSEEPAQKEENAKEEKNESAPSASEALVEVSGAVLTESYDIISSQFNMLMEMMPKKQYLDY